MAGSRKIVKVFLGSPGDLAAERRAAKQVVDRFNQQWAEFFGVHIELIGWEQMASRAGRPQDLINRELLDQSDLFVGMIWKHWGSPPGGDGRYTSGFEEEFERSLERRQKTNKPEMSLLFKEVNADQEQDPGPELKKVLAFKDKIVAEKPVLFGKFGELRDFELKFETCLSTYVQSLAAEEEQAIVDETNAPVTTSGTTGTALEVAPVKFTPLGTEGAGFLRQFLSKTEGDLRENPLLPQEIARFRLLSRIVSATGNDDVALGVHDANLLYAHHERLRFGQREMEGLISSGLEHFAGKVTPLWHWYIAADAQRQGTLAIQSFIGQSAQRMGALKALTMLGEPLTMPDWFSGDDEVGARLIIVRSWFDDQADSRVRVAALEYLAKTGMSSDIPIVQAELDRKNYQTVGAATDALLRLTLREGRGLALTRLLELQPESIAGDLVDQIFTKPTGIETSQLLQAAAHRNVAVRRAAVTILFFRKAIDVALAEQLLNDGDARIRHLAIQCLIKEGREYPDDKAKAVLVKPTKGLLSGPFAPLVPDSEGDEQFRQFRAGRLKALSINSLTKLAEGGNILDQEARFALDVRKWTTRAPALRAAVDDKFKAEFDAEIKIWESRKDVGAETLKRLLGLEIPIRKDLTKTALGLLCGKGEDADLPRIRQAMTEEFIDYSDEVVRYIEAHGGWEDISLLIALAERVDKGMTLSILGDDTKVKSIASAIAVLAKGRLADLLSLDMSFRLRPHVIAKVAESEFVGLGDDEIMKLLLDENDQIRTRAVLKVVRTFPKARMRALLRRYIERDAYRYYNVIHWLDFGISMPKAKVARGVAFALRELGE